MSILNNGWWFLYRLKEIQKSVERWPEEAWARSVRSISEKFPGFFIQIIFAKVSWCSEDDYFMLICPNLYNFRIFSASPQCVLRSQLQIMLLYSTLLCKKIARAPGGVKKYKPTTLGGGGGGEQNRSQFSYLYVVAIVVFGFVLAIESVYVR